MNALTKTENVDPSTGEITTTGLPAGYQAGNQSLAVSIAMAEVDQQITTAHAYPRSVDLAVKNILTLATLDEETAKECVYALPRGGKPIKGPSIRLAEIIQSQWGNNRVGTRVVHVDRIEKYIEAEGVFHDLETNSATTSRVRRRIVDSRGKLYNDDMIIVTGNAAASIAKRNAILAGVPKAVWRKAYGEVERVIVGDVTTMAEKREDAMKAFAAFGVTPERIFAALEIGGLADINLEHYTTLIGMHQALRSGEATVEEMFPVAKPKADQPADLKGKLDKLAEGKDQPSTAGDQPAKQQETQESDAGSSPSGSDAPGKQASTPKATATEQKPSSAPVPPADDGDPIAVATRLGRAAYRNDLSERAVPADYKQKGREAEKAAWIAGFRDEADKDAPEPGSVEED
ncbi:hypothetical protein EOA60_09610 [Mesorhizobium sp. M1A.F.Ca.IN.020.06.1.1]|uniref:hypothetical protein n=1 Tax=unclassified Mesorhizobium TaxID=325217 RepID=UPI000FCB6A58|nr:MULTISPECIES: hypothetical protein [unclassified Mesorhizobium]RUV84325.1 hypothetical protein EOA51_22145 [Mesorhizobium sp. M1A.F.Ca.IN.020.32.1.1]RUW13862.1 hypothetical protein EOA46_05205 [Mesorhizobium sp. M1A.F.Ca.IN.022.05.2.1]RUW32385.1 hypothetical protein EOA60_09610 [Mesorhizobium sp. M1A.F.Ca.IN.020.06.1.1]RWF81325.1 MAG: hypothetical protein EOQ35_14290 [Mesorhizobium sp.]RWG06181.1 MAG: hypothetical protein EOQ38_02070 [Mesorhizobium sp.]